MNRPGTEEIARAYLEPLKDAGIDTLVLGCTHYPLLREVIENIMGQEVIIVDPARSLAREVGRFLESNPQIPPQKGTGHQFFFSARPYHLDLISRLCLGQKIQGRIINRD